MDELAEQFGVKPDLLSLFSKDPILAARCFFGPCIPAQYRLDGPGKWNGAKETIEHTISNTLAPLRTRVVRKLPRNPYKTTMAYVSSVDCWKLCVAVWFLNLLS